MPAGSFFGPFFCPIIRNFTNDEGEYDAHSPPRFRNGF